jgi:hypothetical protein
MKRKKINWDSVPWTPFEVGTLPPSELSDHPVVVFLNSRYQVNVYKVRGGEFGDIAWLSIKTRDKQARHDWRDLQRIKNEIIGPEYVAVEIYPKESNLVDTANQYHLWVFMSGYDLPFGFHDGRLVGDGNWRGSKQRPWPNGERPDDCMTADYYDARVSAGIIDALRKQGEHDDD